MNNSTPEEQEEYKNMIYKRLLSMNNFSNYQIKTANLFIKEFLFV